MQRIPPIRACLVALLCAGGAGCDEPPTPGPRALQLLVTDRVRDGIRGDVAVIGPLGADLTAVGASGQVDVLVDDVPMLTLVPPDFTARYLPDAPDEATLHLVAVASDGRRSAPLALRVDRAAPVIVATTPPAGARVAELTELAFTFTDQSRVDFFGSALRASIDGRPLVEGTDFVRIAHPPAGLSLGMRAAFDGTLAVAITPRDVVGNVAADATTYVLDIDRTPPVFTIVTPTPGTILRGPFTLLVDAAEDSEALGWSLVDARGDRRTGVLAANGGAWSADLDLHGLSDGPLSLSVTAVDAVQNSYTATVPSLVIEGAAPELVDLAPPLGAWVTDIVAMRVAARSDQDRLARLEARADGTLVAAISFNQDGLAVAAVSPAPTTLTIFDASQRKTVLATGWRVDRTPPELTWSPPPTALGGVPLAAPPAITPIALDGESGPNQAATVASLVVTPPPGGRAGTWRATAVPMDLVGNVGPAVSATWQVDGQSPEVQVLAPLEGAFVGPRLEVLARVADDDHVADVAVVIADAFDEGVARAGLVPDPNGLVHVALDLGGLAEGPLVLGVRARDRAGLVGQSDVAVVLDRTAPVLDDPEVPTAAVARSFELPLGASDDGSGVVAFEAWLGATRVGLVTLDAIDRADVTLNVQLGDDLASGPFELRIVTRDAVGLRDEATLALVLAPDGAP